MIDIGVNLTNKCFDKDLTEVIVRAKNKGVHQLIITGTNVDESKKGVALCQHYQQQFPNTLYTTVGVHPHDADAVNEGYLNDLSKLAEQPCVKAIGECGLDFNRNFSTPEKQLVVFKEQIQLAKQLNKPLFLHQRDAFQAWFNALSPFIDQVPAMVAHCFTGNKEELVKCVDAGMYIGITGWLCDERRGSSLQEIINLIPLDKLLVETDAPYLIPRTIRPKPKSNRNEPSYLPFIIDKIAHILALDPEELVSQTSINAQQVFDLPS
ncbi:TatD family hydrolase [Colwellia sp. 6_MG-2023]|uniref:TatD family hydrolase n=1 Tax=Colwellia sp. 6_MG-2023 TaxID=3062676 RepID=UPI0026E1F339|nr:TatD family hydrolase [Colwellia sp. 6_MG-2023]MDO6487764.1 TatD family hydrolase [Colwellia sp. 6_MG-2023]